MKITENILLLFIFLVLIFPQTCFSMNNHICTPSSCGDIGNISFPFRLKNDPKQCGNRDYELSCENNVTLLYLNTQKYQVEEINYGNFTIRLVDDSINKTNTCSFPNHSLYQNYFSYGYPYSNLHKQIYPYRNPFYVQGFPEVAWPINFMSCPYPLKNSSFLTEINGCVSNSSNSRHTYIKVGHMHASEVRDMCRIDVIVMTSWKFKDVKNVSVSDIHDSLLYGFELSWLRSLCSKCKRSSFCYINEDHTVTCSSNSTTIKLICVLTAVVLLVVGVGLCISAQIILGLTCCLGLSIYLFYRYISFGAFNLHMLPIGLVRSLWIDIGPIGLVRSLWIDIVVVFVEVISIPVQIIHLGLSFLFISDTSWASNVAFGLVSPGIFIAVALAIRFIIGFICLMGFLIYKFRRRHLSLFDAIETFLRSDNKLVPIRYSYSHIKKMTRGFREKLGEGGYGKVYKGKLRSGTDVAVKLLGKSGGNGQDFMNEISTIGRIHHVNVVKLVGYCAERSKRALVYDFMPNGSLDKYIYSQDRVNILDWQTKYKIALGVARGIEYLHRGCNIQILHFDIKPHNILLDDKFIPKISDFGLAKFYSTDKKTVTLTAARGTIGYVAPELMNRGFGRVSYKADVYSFGMLLIEMVSLKKNLRGNDEESTQYFPDWIYNSIDQGRDDVIEIGEIVEDDDNVDTKRIARKMTIVALWCIQMSPDNRPLMNKVLEMLEGEVERLQIPQRPTQQTRIVFDEEQSWTTYSTDSASLLRNDAAPSFEITVQD